MQVLAQARACSCLSPSTFYTHNFWKADKDPEKKTDGGPACSRLVSETGSSVGPAANQRRSSLVTVKSRVARADLHLVHPLWLPEISPRRHTRSSHGRHGRGLIRIAGLFQEPSPCSPGHLRRGAHPIRECQSPAQR